MKILIKIDGYILKIASIFILLSVCLLIGLEDIDIGHKKIFWIIAMVVIIIALSFFFELNTAHIDEVQVSDQISENIS